MCCSSGMGWRQGPVSPVKSITAMETILTACSREFMLFSQEYDRKRCGLRQTLQGRRCGACCLSSGYDSVFQKLLKVRTDAKQGGRLSGICVCSLSPVLTPNQFSACTGWVPCRRIGLEHVASARPGTTIVRRASLGKVQFRLQMGPEVSRFNRDLLTRCAAGTSAG